MALTALQQQLAQFLTQDAAQPAPLYASLSDAAVATALNAQTVPVSTPLTIGYLSGVWGAGAVTILQALVAAANGTSAIAGYALLAYDAIKSGDLSAQSPLVQAQIAAFVSVGILTQAQATAALYTYVWAPGNGLVQATDVTAARAQMALTAAQNLAKTQVAAGWNAVQAAIGAATTASAVPTQAQINSIFAAAVG